MATSYPNRTNARGIWKLDDITKNIKTEGTWPQGSTRGIYNQGGAHPAFSDVMEYITIETLGNGTDFGNLSAGRNQNAGLSSATRGVFGGGYTAPAAINVIEYVTILTTGNMADFGNLTVARRGLGANSNDTRGIFAGGEPSTTNILDYITIASTGNAIDFGDLTVTGMGFQNSVCCSTTRAVFTGSNTPSHAQDAIGFVQFSTTGNAVDFGDQTQGRTQPAGA